MFIKFGHRGARGSPRFTENTIGALRSALTRGARGLEFDVRRAGDGTLVLMHDAAVDRTTNGKGSVAEMTIEELRVLNAGNDKVPILEEVIDLFAGSCFLNIEMVDAGIAHDVKELLLRKRINSEILISAFDNDDNDDFNYPDHLSSWGELAEMQPEFPIALLASKIKIDAMGGERVYLDTAARMGAAAVHPEDIAVTPALIRAAHSKGLKVRIFSSKLNNSDDLERFERMGADGMFFDFCEET